MSSNPPSSQSFNSGPTTSYGPRSLLVMALGCAGFGVFFWYLYGELRNPSPMVIDEVTETRAGSDSTTDSEFQRQMEELSRLHQQIAETLKTLDDKANAAANASYQSKSAYREFIRKQAEAAGFTITDAGAVSVPGGVRRPTSLDK